MNQLNKSEIEQLPAVGEVGEVKRLEEDLCVHCLEVVGHHANFCIHCRAPLGFLAGTVPYYSVFAEGFILRTAVCKPRNLITVIGVWFIFGNYLLMGFWLAWYAFPESLTLTKNWTHWYFTAIYGGMTAIGLVGIIRCTSNYVSSKPTRLIETP